MLSGRSTSVQQCVVELSGRSTKVRELSGRSARVREMSARSTRVSIAGS